jgi:hypothetical protein
MELQLATAPGGIDRDNEDFAAAGPGLLVLLDGAGAPSGLESGCLHTVAWYARTLGGLFLGEAVDTRQSLAGALAKAIEKTNELHGGSCDLAHPGTASSTVLAVRFGSKALDYLVLCDSVLAVERSGADPLIISDQRLRSVYDKLDEPEERPLLGTDEHAAAYLSHVERLATYRNHEDGFWVASTNPTAAHHALTGSISLDDVTAVTLLSDGASRLIDRFNLLSWPDTLAMLHKHGPEYLIARTREAEATDLDGRRWPRGKVSDDATIVYARLTP